MCTSIHAKIQKNAKNRKFLVVPAVLVVPGIPVVPFHVPRFRRCHGRLGSGHHIFALAIIFDMLKSGVSTFKIHEVSNF